ncbi:DEAD/DEAH box helicase [Thermoanaerobacterium saccharolyticum]|uniref:DNA 3'-5' helicase n=2 Tax=Thermoanaerobacterium TaxID=28895 RepID=W9EIR0_9THEO|nr:MULTISPECIES: DEAD/DEAH box helicase [Thermoanaerobacterium]AFK87286.1 DEAD/DEAH box helicase domain protein [Thermoanaerobacterium saccharolyticum JW/SL-YS485]ETO39584.1 DEAD/DEAH box helicase [Thermoanaerobacterium aotearoense SCUT27]
MINLKDLISEIIQSYLKDDETIIVLKGFSIKLYDNNITIDIDDILKNDKLKYFNLINERRVITYEEYLILYSFIIYKFKKITILENNIYINYFPLYVDIPEYIKKSLLINFDEDNESDEEIGNLSDYIAIYSNFKYINGKYYVVYNNIISDEKEEKYPVFTKADTKIEKEVVTSLDKCYKLDTEESYVTFLDDIIEGKVKDIHILGDWHNAYNSYLDKLQILKNIYESDIDIKIGYVKDRERPVTVRKEYYEILKKYWGKDAFRKIKMYDIDRLYIKEKVVKSVSQGEIIERIVEEVEKCYRGENYRDIFVTAPTGSGKSAMFQIPAIYLAEKYELFTIVISPLIGLMNDQVYNLDKKNYKYARTINSDISPIKRQEIMNEIADKKCHILYLSPESLLSKSDLEQIIGDRQLGLLVIDEAHIVTTWGKQFRPDYWYLGDHLDRIKKYQRKNGKPNFVIATFTATAIYGGMEDMYDETIQSLKMLDPITYLGYVKRNDIKINIEKSEVTITQKDEYELNKFDKLIEKMNKSLTLGQKMLIYFPTIALINRFYEYCIVNNLGKYITKYHGRLTPYEKRENYTKFKENKTPVMLATKAFGMGIDIDDIDIIAHFAPTGNVCDYVQEIGRAARKLEMIGEAYYNFMRNDFKHINKLHGLSTVKEYQLINVIKKVYELYLQNIKNNFNKKLTKRRNAMLVDAESFQHIFENPFFDEEDGINKVKTAMLLIQKDFERRFAFSPFNIRPIPLFEIGYFKIDPKIQKAIIEEYGDVLHEEYDYPDICSVNLKKIWEENFYEKYSFPKFKYMLYSRDHELDFEHKNEMRHALCVEIYFKDSNYLNMYNKYINAVKDIIYNSVRESKYYKIDGKGGLVDLLMTKIGNNEYKAKSIVESIISSMSIFQRDYNKNIHSRIYTVKPLKTGEIEYRFMSGVAEYFRWIDRTFNYIINNVDEGKIYLVDDIENGNIKEMMLILGLMESLDLLIFKALGGKNSQIYIYVNQTKTMKEIIEKPYRYKNKLLEIIGERHKISVAMLTYLFDGNFSSEEFWDLIEDYFLGILPKEIM